MKLSKVGALGLSLAIAGSVVFASPALAATYTPDTPITIGPNSGQWEWNVSNDWSMNRVTNSIWDFSSYPNGTFGAIWDTTEFFMFGSDNTTSTKLACSSGQDLSVANDGSQDQILTCDAQGLNNGDGNLDVSVESRFFSDGQTWRVRVSVTNPGASPISDQVLKVASDSWQDSGTALSYSTTVGPTSDWATSYNAVPSATVSPSDVFWITDNRTGNGLYPAPVMSYAMGDLTASVRPANNAARSFVSGGLGNGTDRSNTYFELPTIAAGQTVQVIFLYKAYLFNPSTTAVSPMDSFATGTYGAVQTAIADRGFATQSVVFAGVPNPTEVVNWKYVAPPPTTSAETKVALAATGIDGVQMVSLAALAGAALTIGAIASRRARSASRKS